MLTKYESDHHIQPGTLAKLGWQDCIHKDRPAIQFPVPTGQRWRYMDGEKPKYHQKVGFISCWYGLKNAVEHARKHSLDFIVDCNGAASTIAADQHGLPAFSLQSGETTKPRTELLAELKSLWSGKVYVAFDCDEPGRTGAIKRVQVYHEAGIDAEALDLALDIKGGDLADFVGRYSELTVECLLECKRLTIPDKPKPKPKAHKSATFADWDAALEAIRSRLSCYDFMCQRYGEPPKKGRSYGHWLAIQRSEDSPSFAAYMETGGFFDYGSGVAGDIFSLIQLADKCDFITAVKLAAELTSVTLPERKVEALKTDDPIEPSEASGLPISMRAALNLYAPSQIGATVEVWQEAIDKGHCKSTDSVSADFLICEAEVLGRYVSSRTIRTAMNLGYGQFFAKSTCIIPNSESDSDSDNLLGNLQDQNNQTPCNIHAGRKPILYTLKPLTEITRVLSKLAIIPLLKAEFPADDPIVAPICAEFLEELGVTDANDKANALKQRYSDTLAAQPNFKKRLAHARKVYAKFIANLYQHEYAPFAADRKFANHREYVAECARAIVAKVQGGTQHSRSELCKLIGCRDHDLPSIFKRAGLVMLKDQYLDREINAFDEFKAIKDEYDYERKGNPDRVVSDLDKQPKTFGAAGTAYWLEKQFYAGAAVKVQYHQANKQILAPEVEIAPSQDKPTTAEIKPKTTPAQPTLFDAITAAVHFWTCWLSIFIFERIYSALCFAWCCLRHLKHVVEKKLTYEEDWAIKFAGVTTEPEVADTLRTFQPAMAVQMSFDILMRGADDG